MKKLKYLLMACCAACVWLAACSDDDYEPLPDWWWEQTGEPAVYPEPEPVDNKVVAHRGCYAETGFPQNSVAGLKKAVEMKLFASECDIHLTKDGKVVVYHDDYYLGNTCFKDATYAELCAKGTLANGEKLPLLEEFIDVVLEGGCTQLWIDVKTLGDEPYRHRRRANRPREEGQEFRGIHRRPSCHTRQGDSRGPLGVARVVRSGGLRTGRLHRQRHSVGQHEARRFRAGHQAG